MIPQKPYAISCDRNSEPILEQFKRLLKDRKALLEVAAGTGQHAIFMAPHFLEMTWTLADRRENHEGISLWLHDFPRANIRGPFEYEIGNQALPKGDFDVLFASNLIHIIPWDLCLRFFDDLKALPSGALIIFYGAYRYGDQDLAESNINFNKWLKDMNPEFGIRDFNEVCSQLKDRSIELVEDIEMPANNRLLVFTKKA